MASNQDCSTSSLPQSNSTLSSDYSQLDLLSVAKSFNFIQIKLDTGNYLFWKAQILATIKAFDLIQFVNKSPPPPKYVSITEVKGSGSTIVNPAYTTWIQSDQLLLGWIFSTIDKEVLA